MKVLVTGASGLLGRAVMNAFEGCEVQGLALNRVDPSKKIVKVCFLLVTPFAAVSFQSTAT